MNQVMATPSAPADGYSRATAFLVTWLRDLEDLHQGGLLSDEDYAVQRAEKLSELLCEHRHLWMASVVAAGCLGAVGASVTWMCTMDWQLTGLGAGLAALFGIVMLARPCRETLKQSQIRDRLDSLNALLAMDLITADEFIVYEERLHAGGRELQLASAFQ
jgi:hypothetical protein